MLASKAARNWVLSLFHCSPALNFWLRSSNSVMKMMGRWSLFTEVTVWPHASTAVRQAVRIIRRSIANQFSSTSTKFQGGSKDPWSCASGCLLRNQKVVCGSKNHVDLLWEGVGKVMPRHLYLVKWTKQPRQQLKKQS